MDPQLTEQSATQVAFVFNNVANYQELAAAFRPGVEVHILDASQDGLAQMAAILQGRSGIEALHVIGHGAQGSLDMGSVTLDRANIGAYGDVLGQIGSALAPGGDILLYGCDVGANASGAQFVGQIAQATGADVAASTDLTGGAQLGGDWTLEYRTGLVTADGAFDAAAVRNLDTLLTPTTEDVSSSMTTGANHFVPGFTLSTAQVVMADTAVGGNGAIWFATTNKSESFTITTDGTTVGAFDLKSMTFLKPGSITPEFTITITGHKADGGTASAVIEFKDHDTAQTILDDFSDMTGLTSFDVVMAQTGIQVPGAYPQDLDLDAFVIDNIIPPNKAPAFVGATTTIDTTENTAVSVLPLLHVNDTDSGQTESWSLKTAPAHGTLSISGATASSGSSDITPGGTITYTPTSGFAGTDTFDVQVSDGSATATRTVTVNVRPVAPSAPDLTNATDTGSSATDNITKATSVSFSGTASVPDGSTALVFIDKNGNGVFDAGTDISGTATVTSGAWTANNLNASTLADGNYNVYAQVTTSGLTGAVGSAGSFTIDRTAPTLAISSDKSALKAGDHATITFTFSEDPGTSFAWNGTSGDVVVTGGTLSVISGTGTIRTATFTPTANTDNGSASISVAAGLYADAAGNNNTAAASTSISFDTKAPTVSVGSNNSSLHIGQTATISFFFSEAPTAFNNSNVTVSGGTLGTITAVDALTYRAVFTPDANTNGGSATVSVNAGGYTDGAGNAGTGGATPPILFDTQAPTVTITSDKTAMGSGDTATITFTFSEDPGATFGLADIVATNGTVSNLSTTGTVRTATFTAGAGATASISVTANSYTDGAGNTGAGANSPTISLDTTPPAAPSTPVLANGSDTGSSATDFKTKLAQPTLSGTAEAGSTVKLYDSDGVTEIGHTTADGSGNWMITTSSLLDGQHIVKAVATDAAGNVGPASGTFEFFVDTTQPTVHITTDRAIFNAGQTANITFVFSEDPGTFDLGSISVDGGTLSGLSGTGNVYTAVFTPTAGVNAGTAHISVAANAYTDVAGNGGKASDNSLAFTYDTLKPTVTVTSDKTVLKVGESANITFTFSEDPGTSFGWDGTVGNLQVTGGTLSAVSGTGTTRTAVFTPAANTDSGTASITVVADSYHDNYNNTGAGASAPAIAFDTLAPDTPYGLALAAGSDSGWPGDDLTKVKTPTVTGVAQAGMTVKLYDGAIEIGHATADGSGNWSIATSTLADGDHMIAAVAYDAAGNASTASGALDVIVDTTPPTLTITSDKAALTIGQTSTITFTFSEDPGTSFTSGSVTVSGGTLGAISGTGLTRTAVFTPAANTDGGTASITVATGKYTDAAGNDGGAGATPGITFDTKAPAVTITSDKPVLTIGQTATITFTFSEDPHATFDLTDTVTTGGTLTNLSGSGLTRTATFTPTAHSSGAASVTVTAGSYSDVAGNAGTAGGTPSLAFDTLAPTVTIDSNKASLKAGEAATITFTFSEDPGAGFTAGSVDVSGGTLTSMSGTGTIRTATFTPDADANGTATILLNQANYHDPAGNQGDNSSSVDIAFDTAVPSMLISSDKSALITGQTTTVTFTFSEDPGASFSWDGTAGDLTVHGGTLSALSGSGAVRTAVFTPNAGTNSGTAVISVTGSYTDGAGNVGVNAGDLTIPFDTQAPDAPAALVLATDTGTSSSDNLTKSARPTVSGTAEAGASVTLKEGATVIGTGTADVHGSWSIMTNTLGDGSHSIVASATDAAGNASTASAPLDITVDTVAPTVSVTSDKATLIANQTANISFTFSEDPGSTFTSDSLTVSGGTLGAISGSGLTRTAVFTPDANVNAGTATIAVKAGGYTDAAGNNGAAGTTPSVQFDTLPPTVAISSNVAALKIGETAVITFTFSEDPGATFSWDGTGGDVTVSGGTLSAISGTGTTRTAIFTPTASTNGGTASITIDAGKYLDAAGNGGHAGATPALVFDTRAPDAPSALALDSGSDKGTSATDNLTYIDTPKLNGTAEAGATVRLYDGATEVGSGTADASGNWSITTSRLAEGSHSIVAAATDAAGNTGPVSGALTVTVDHTPPTLTITSDQSALKAGEHATITFTFSEDPGSTFTSDSIVVSNGTLGPISGTGNTRTAVFTPTADVNAGTASITVAAGKYTDAAGNGGTAAGTPSIHFDTLVPTVTITSDKTALKIGETAVITFTFSEDPGTSFNAGSVSVNGGTLSAISGTGTTRTAVFTPAPDTNGGVASITVGEGKYLDAAGNGGHAGATPGLHFDTLVPGAPSVPLLATDSGSSASDGLTNATSLIFTGTAEAGATVTLINDATKAVLATGVADGGHWSIAVDHLPEGAIQVAAFATDAAGNIGSQSTAASVTIDRTAPGAPSLALGSSSSGTVNVQGLDAGASWQYSLDNGAHWQNGSGSTFQVHADGSYSAVAHQIDAAGNIGTASAPLAFTVDTTGPTSKVALSDTSLTTGETAKVTFTFSEPVVGFDLADITAPNGTMSGLASSDGGRTWTATFTPAVGVTADTNTITVNNAGVTDIAGNAGTGTTSSDNYSVLTAGVGASITLSDTDLLAGETAQVSIVFGAAVTGFELSDLSAPSGKLSDLRSSDGSHWTALFTPSTNTSDATNVITLDNSGVVGAHGTRGTGTSSSDNYVVNTIRPTATVAVADHLLAPGATTTVSIKFSEAVSGFDASDLTVSHGTLSKLASSDGGRTWTASLTGDSGGTSATPGSVSLNMGGVHNGAGNTGTGNVSAQFVVTSANSKSVAVDGVPVITDTVTNPGTGHQDQLIAVQAVPANRTDDPSTPNHGLADIPLVASTAGASAAPVLTASLPGGVGMMAQGPSTPLNTQQASLDLISRIDDKTTAGSSSQSDMASQGQAFLDSLGGSATLQTQTITLNGPAGDTSPQTILISGAAHQNATAASAPASAFSGVHADVTPVPTLGLVIDASGLAPGSTIQLANIDFAAVLGDVRVVATAGHSYLVGDAGKQVFIGGAAGDVLSGGGGDDALYGAAGNDQIAGGDGNNLLAGGAGNDTVSGGAGDDTITGGRSASGDWAFHMSSGGVISATHGNAVFATNGTETVQGSELDATLPELGFLKADPQKVQGIALLYAALDRAPDVAGLSYWVASGASLQDVAKGVLASSEFGGGALGHTDDATFVRGMYEHVLGREPAAADLSYWTGRLAGSDGKPAAARADVLLMVALSDEHKAHATGADGVTIAQASLKQETGWFAGSGDDRLTGGAGNDLLVGGDGNDTIVYDGKQSQYHFTIGQDNALHVVDTASGDVDTIVSVESAAFKDGTIDISFLKADPAQLDRIGLLYQAVLDRAADAAGLKWFLSSGMDAAHLASAIVGSSEFKSHYAGMNDAAFVQALYANSGLDATAAGGEQSWEAFLASHTRAELVAAWITQGDVVHAQFGSSGLWLV